MKIYQEANYLTLMTMDNSLLLKLSQLALDFDEYKK
jgi:hypothetical protein